MDEILIHRTVNITPSSTVVRLRAGVFSVGDVIDFTLSTGEEVSAMAMRIDADGTLFVFVDSLNDTRQMNSTNTNRGGYESSDLRRVLNTEILNTFPNHIRRLMKPFSNGDKLRLLTEGEVFGANEYGEADGDTQLVPMQKRRNRIAFRGKGTDRFEWYWLQNKRVASSTAFADVDHIGVAYYTGASSSHGVRPAFKI